MPLREAERRAVEAMGNPEELGRWLALAGLAAGETGGGRFPAGEVTIQEGDGAARAAALRLQAETVLGPWLADRGFAFQGVPG